MMILSSGSLSKSGLPWLQNEWFQKLPLRTLPTGLRPTVNPEFPFAISRYERWNPVHPTYGAFWGIGIGIGCGVGWGPGFGPEVIGYVGAGCGAGFSVGITLAGFGIGLPANNFFTAPYNAFMATRSGTLDVARSSGLLSIRNDGREGWFNLDPQISGLQQKIGGAFSTLTVKDSLKNAIDFSDLKTQSSLLTKGFLERMKTISKHESKGSEDG